MLRLYLVQCKIFFGWKYFQVRKIFYSVWLYFKNYIRKPFSMFDNILKMLFFYKFFTFSQHPNKFYYKNFNIYTLKKQKSAQNNSLNFIQIWSNWEREEERVIENFRERETMTRSLVRGDRDDEIGSTDELWVDNENEINNDGTDE